jgi:hypothetical protein
VWGEEEAEVEADLKDAVFNLRAAMISKPAMDHARLGSDRPD